MTTTVRAVGIGPLDLRAGPVPVAPKQKAARRMDGDAARIDQLQIFGGIKKISNFWNCSKQKEKYFTFVLKRTRRTLESKLATSTVSLIESVQYMFLDAQSIAMPSGDPMSVIRDRLRSLIYVFVKNLKIVCFTRIEENFGIGSVVSGAGDCPSVDVAPVDASFVTVNIDT